MYWEAAARVAKCVVGIAVGCYAAFHGIASRAVGTGEDLCWTQVNKTRKLKGVERQERKFSKGRATLTPSLVDVPWRKVSLAALDGSPINTTAATTKETKAVSKLPYPEN